MKTKKSKKYLTTKYTKVTKKNKREEMYETIVKQKVKDKIDEGRKNLTFDSFESFVVEKKILKEY